LLSDQGEVIAVVDDDPVMRQAMDRLLSACGYRVETYGSADDFVAVALKTEAKCLLLDVQLGPITGIELARHLVSMGLSFPTIFITASDDERFRRDAVALGCVDYLWKPFPPNRLISAITKAIG
jgi:FixJ family two-component response regulator